MLKRGRLSADVARLVFETFEAIPIRYVSIEFGNALQLCDDHQLYAYDAEPEASDADLRFVPFFAWANRKPGEMLVWVRESAGWAPT